MDTINGGKMNTIRIVCDGNPSNTVVYDANTGKELRGIEWAEITICVYKNTNTAIIKFFDVEVDFKGETP